MNASAGVSTALTGPELSWIVPMYRTADALPELLRRIDMTVDRLAIASEIVLVDDACPERSADRAAEITSRTPKAVVRLDRNVGQDQALREGMRRCGGRWAVLLDGDLQDPPEAVAQLWTIRAPFDVVFADRIGHYESSGRLLTSRLYRRCVELVGGLPRGAGLFVLVKRPVVDAVVVSTSTRFSMLAAIASASVGGARTSVVVERAPRMSGGSSYSAFDRLARGLGTLGQMLLGRSRHDRS